MLYWDKWLSIHMQRNLDSFFTPYSKIKMGHRPKLKSSKKIEEPLY